jgi:protein-L-isoaspartate(D-aspartate) O-methyltransferase
MAAASHDDRQRWQGCRVELVESLVRQLGDVAPRHLRAILEVPRERYVRPEDVERSAEDTPMPLDTAGLATISAPHAYLLSYGLLGLVPGDSLVELGTGSGYGAALAAFIVGAEGRVLTFEIDGGLAAWARRNLVDDANVTVIDGDATASSAQWQGATKVAATFAVHALPGPWLDALPEGGLLVAPVGPSDRDQRLVLAERRHGRVVVTDHGAVRYVKNRSTAEQPNGR